MQEKRRQETTLASHTETTEVPAIKLRTLCKAFGTLQAVDHLTLEVAQGEIFGLLGPNGSGKTTTMRTLMGLLRPTSGSAEMFGLDCWKESTRIKKLVGYLPGEFTFDSGMRGSQIIAYLGHLHGGVDHTWVRCLMERLGFDPTKRFRDYSRGTKQKVGLIQAFMHRPRLLILDEPTSGLDPLNQQEFYRLVAEAHKEGCTVFLSSHILPEIEHTCDRVAIIREGRLVTIDQVSSLKGFRQREVEISFAGPASVEWFNHARSVISVERRADGQTLHLQIQGDLTEIIPLAAQHRATNITTHKPSLEEVFLQFYEPGSFPRELDGER